MAIQHTVEEQNTHLEDHDLYLPPMRMVLTLVASTAALTLTPLESTKPDIPEAALDHPHSYHRMRKYQQINQGVPKADVMERR